MTTPDFKHELAPPIEPGTMLCDVLRTAPFAANDTRLLVGHALCLSRTQLITQSQYCLTENDAARVNTLFSRRKNGEPIAYILGKREFYGLSIHVTPAVLIPRADTELLVDLALARAKPGAHIADLGTGSGAVAVAVARSRSDLHVVASDISNAALEVARHNAALHRTRITFIQSDWLTEFPAQKFDLIIVNPPYIAAHDHHLNESDLPHEPIDALTDHADGLNALRAIIGSAGAYLNVGGWLLLEHGYDQAHSVRELLIASEFESVQSWVDIAGIERVSGGCKASTH